MGQSLLALTVSGNAEVIVRQAADYRNRSRDRLTEEGC